MELTKEYFDQVLSSMASKNDLAALATGDEIAEIETETSAIKDILAQHSTALAGLATDLRTLIDEKSVSAVRLDRLEKWAAQVGQQLGIRLEL